MIVVPYEPAHVIGMQLQKRQAFALSYLSLGYLSELKRLGPSATALVDGHVIACGGIAVQSFGQGTLWAFVAQEAGPHMVRLDRCIRRLIAIPKLRRIEATTEEGFVQGCRWLELLGFQYEGPLRRYGPAGEDHVRYARV